MKFVKIAALAFLVMFLLFGASIGISVWSGIREAQEQAAQEVIVPDMSEIPDGTWNGRVEWGVLIVQVNVTTQQGEITNIELLEHEHGRGSDGEKIIPKILEQQSLDIDHVSGATISSRAILHAVADALNSAK